MAIQHGRFCKSRPSLRSASAAAGLLVGVLGAATAASAAGCQLQQAAELHVVNEAGSPLIEAQINGRKVVMIVDTGASTTMILRSAAVALGLPRTTVSNTRIFGAGGETVPEVTTLRRFQLGEAGVSNLQLMVGGEQGRTFGDVAGLLGWDILSHWDVEFDMAHKTIRLLSPKACKGDQVAYWASAYSAAPMNGGVGGDQHIETTVLLNGRSVDAFLDSGASRSVMTPSAAVRAGIRSADAGRAVEDGYGVGSAALKTRVVTLDSFKFGDELIHHADLSVSDLFSKDRYSKTGSLVGEQEQDLPDMLLGADFLRAHRMLVATDQRMIYFTYNGGPVFDTRRPETTAQAPFAGAVSPPPDVKP